MDILDCIFTLIVAFLGYYVGNKEKKGEDITVNPIKIYKEEIVKPIKEMKEEKIEEEKISELRTIMNNLESYNGSSKGQKKVGAK